MYIEGLTDELNVKYCKLSSTYVYECNSKLFIRTKF